MPSAQILSRHVLEAGGYLAEVSDGFVLSLYRDPGAALLGLLRCQAALVEHDWDEQLLVRRAAMTVHRS